VNGVNGCRNLRKDDINGWRLKTKVLPREEPSSARRKGASGTPAEEVWKVLPRIPAEEASEGSSA